MSINSEIADGLTELKVSPDRRGLFKCDPTLRQGLAESFNILF
jgi:hypothetical protein